MSWFTIPDSIQGLADTVAEAVPEDVKNMVPKLDRELLEKLTLTTPEMNAERERLRREEEERLTQNRRLRHSLLPWETHDPDRDILVEECRDAILALTSKQNYRETFFGPYQMPRAAVKLDDGNDHKKKKTETAAAEAGDETSQQGRDDEKEDIFDDDEDETDGAVPKGGVRGPSSESLVKLAKLEPLPPLLENFELPIHVPLIERMMVEDPNLVEHQSQLSGT